MKLFFLFWACVGAPTKNQNHPADVPAAPLEPGTPQMPYGFWGLNGFVTPTGFEEAKQRLGLSIFQVACSDIPYAIHTLLPMVRDAHLTLTLRMTDDHPAYTDAEGNFNLAAWKTQVSAWKDSGVQHFIDDGTLVGHMLLDDIDTFPGRDPDGAELEEMARYSKELMPGLMTYVRKQASGMPVPPGGQYRWVDAAVNQYEVKEGAVSFYAVHEALAAKRLNLGIINGLNIADGGDGRSGQPGYRAKHWAMSADEIRLYGNTLAKVPGCGMFLNWEYDANEAWNDGTIGAQYFQKPDLQAALQELGSTVRSLPAVPLLKPSPQP